MTLGSKDEDQLDSLCELNVVLHKRKLYNFLSCTRSSSYPHRVFPKIYVSLFYRKSRGYVPLALVLQPGPMKQ